VLCPGVGDHEVLVVTGAGADTAGAEDTVEEPAGAPAVLEEEPTTRLTTVVFTTLGRCSVAACPPRRGSAPSAICRASPALTRRAAALESTTVLRVSARVESLGRRR
jgi:hypothetical protein